MRHLYLLDEKLSGNRRIFIESSCKHSFYRQGISKIAGNSKTEQAQRPLSKEFVPVRVSARHRIAFDFDVMAVFRGRVKLSNARSRSGIQLDFQQSFDGDSLSLPVGGSMSIGAGMTETASQGDVRTAFPGGARCPDVMFEMVRSIIEGAKGHARLLATPSATLRRPCEE